jgi:hypothetical protein
MDCRGCDSGFISFQIVSTTQHGLVASIQIRRFLLPFSDANKSPSSVSNALSDSPLVRTQTLGPDQSAGAPGGRRSGTSRRATPIRSSAIP